MLLVLNAVESEDERDFLVHIYNEYKLLMLYTAHKYIADINICEDVVQDSIESLIKKVGTLMGLKTCVLVAYIVTTVRNTAINHLRRQNTASKYIENIEDSRDIKILSFSESVENIVINEEFKEDFKRIFMLLDERDRQVMECKYILGYTDEETAKLLGCKADSVRMMLTRARRNSLKMLTKGGIK